MGICASVYLCLIVSVLDVCMCEYVHASMCMSEYVCDYVCQCLSICVCKSVCDSNEF